MAPGFTYEFLPMKTEPKFQPYIGLEDHFQISAARFLDSIPGCHWFHVANERKTDTKTNRKGQTYSPSGSKLKSKGVKRGVLDNFIMDHRQGFCGFVIELKVSKNKLSDEQIEWLAFLKSIGWKVLVTRSLDELIFEVEQYFGIKTIAQRLKT